MAEQEENRTLNETVATNEEEARAMVARMGGVVRGEGEDQKELSDEELDSVNGGAFAYKENVYVDGGLYLTSYAEGYCGQICGVYQVHRYKPGKPAPYLLFSNLGWVKEESVSKA